MLFLTQYSILNSRISNGLQKCSAGKHSNQGRWRCCNFFLPFFANFLPSPLAQWWISDFHSATGTSNSGEEPETSQHQNLWLLPARWVADFLLFWGGELGSWFSVWGKTCSLLHVHPRVITFLIFFAEERALAEYNAVCSWGRQQVPVWHQQWHQEMVGLGQETGNISKDRKGNGKQWGTCTQLETGTICL